MYGGDNICKELRECKLKEELEKKRRQQLRANNHELRQLERQLQSAVVSKQLREQQQNIAQLKVEEYRKKLEQNVKFEAECEVIRKSLLQQEEQAKEGKMALLQMLKSQMIKQQHKRRSEFEDINNDRNEMNKLMKQNQAEKIAEHKKAEMIREIRRKEMEESLRDIKWKRQQEKERNDAEAARNLAYQEECDHLKSQMLAERKLIQKEKDALSAHVAQQLATQIQEKEKRDNLFITLLVEEQKAKDDQSFREALVKRINKREKLRIEMEKYQQEIKNKKEEQFMEEEKKFQQEHLRYLEERDKIEQLSNEKRRRKNMEHIKALREMIEIRRCQKASEIAARIADFEQRVNDEMKSEQLIEEERTLMLSGVPKELLRYLPPGVLKSSDKDFLTISEQKTYFQN